MALITWNNSFLLGIEQIDEQHRSLVGLLNDFHDAVRNGTSKEKLLTALNFLATYTVDHFTAEEELMRVSGYPELESHQEQHRALMGEVFVLLEKYKNEEKILGIEVCVFLADWIQNHIIKNDREIGAYLKGKK